MNVELVIPVYNEQTQVAASVGQVARFVEEQHTFGWEIVVADNGSTDGTWVIAGELKRRADIGAASLGRATEKSVRLRVLHLDERGRGRALKTAWSQSHADILTYMDVDLSTDLSAFMPLVHAVASGSYDVAIGTRLHPESVTRRCWKRELISRCYNRLVRLVFGVHFSDAQCGFKAITREAAAALLPEVEDTGWFFDTELLVLAEKAGFRIYEQPVRWTEDPDSRVRLVSTAWADLVGMWRLRKKLNEAGARAVQPMERNANKHGIEN